MVTPSKMIGAGLGLTILATTPWSASVLMVDDEVTITETSPWASALRACGSELYQKATFFLICFSLSSPGSMLSMLPPASREATRIMRPAWKDGTGSVSLFSKPGLHNCSHDVIV